MLQELSLASHAISPAAAAAFAAALGSNRTLRSLDLGNSAFGDEASTGRCRMLRTACHAAVATHHDRMHPCMASACNACRSHRHSMTSRIPAHTVCP